MTKSFSPREVVARVRAVLRLLALLAAQPGRAMPRQELLEAQPGSSGDERTVEAHVKNLRQRLGDCGDQLETVRGIGYRLRPRASPLASSCRSPSPPCSRSP